MHWYLLIIVSLVNAVDRESGKVSYKIDVRSDFKNCDGFNNEKIISTLIVKTDDDYSYWNGDLIFKQEFGRGTLLKIEVFKKGDNLEEEFSNEMIADLCETMDDEDVPWTPLIDVMGRSCPVAAKTYHFENVSLSLERVKDMMTRQMCNDFRIQLNYVSPLGPSMVPETMACYTFDIAIMEITE